MPTCNVHRGTTRPHRCDAEPLIAANGLALLCRYSSFVTALDECSRDNLEFLRERAVKAIYELLRNKAEQESQLLRALVNKLGDPSRKVASNVSPQLGGISFEGSKLHHKRPSCGVAFWLARCTCTTAGRGT